MCLVKTTTNKTNKEREREREPNQSQRTNPRTNQKLLPKEMRRTKYIENRGEQIQRSTGKRFVGGHTQNSKQLLFEK